MKTRIICIAATLLAASVSTPVVANDDGLDVHFDLEAGWLSDSNVNVAQLDQNTGRGDDALHLNAAVGAKLSLTDRLKAGVDYGYTGTRYARYSEFDLALHRVAGNLTYARSGFDVSLTGERFDALLDTEDFLEIRQVTPALGKLFGNRLYLRGAYTAADKELATDENRSASSESLRADAYWLLDGMNRFISIAYISDEENALDPVYDYAGTRTSIGLGQKIGEGSRHLMLRAKAQFEQRDYANFDESIEAARRDSRFRAELSATFALSEHFSLQARATRADSESNLASAEFDETTWLLGLGLSF